MVLFDRFELKLPTSRTVMRWLASAMRAGRLIWDIGLAQHLKPSSNWRLDPMRGTHLGAPAAMMVRAEVHSSPILEELQLLT